MPRYIDAEALDSALLTEGLASALTGYPHRRKLTVGEVRGILQRSPTADVVPARRGEWVSFTTAAYVRGDEFADRKYYRCSECRQGSAIQHNFCPSCGADMRKEPTHDQT